MVATIAVIGAGAAGMMAALHAATAGARVVVLEQTADGGRKLLLCGGGRCNLLPSVADERRFRTSSSPNTLRRVLRSWPLAQQQSFFRETLGLALVTEADTGKIFPASGQAQEVRDALFAHAMQRGVQVRTGAAVTGLMATADGWEVQAAGSTLRAAAVIVACGGLSYPQTGSDGSLWPLLARLGHTLIPAVPALVPLITEESPLQNLAGVSLAATVTAVAGGSRATATGGFLFTHRGCSGPAVLEVSHIVARARQQGAAFRVTVQWTADDAAAWRARLHAAGARPAVTLLRETLPARLAETLCLRAGIAPDASAGQLRHAERERLIAQLTECVLPVTGDAGYAAAEITDGGVRLDDVSAGTLASRHCPRLFFAGEVLDVTGMIGGCNLQWAWTSGRLAGLAADRSHPAV